jgi:adenosine deaminase
MFTQDRSRFRSTLFTSLRRGPPVPDLPELRRAHTLATDHEGISRTDLTREYARATTTYDLDYSDLKTLARNSLNHAFLTGERLWHAPDT